MSTDASTALHLTVNGEAQAVPAEEDVTLAALLRHLDFDPAQPGIAVAVDDAVVRRQEWEAKTLHGGENVEIITAQQGG